MCCGGDKNRTDPIVFETIEKQGKDFRSSDIIGAGIFVIPAPDIGILEYKIVYVDGLSYTECMKRGANCESFPWIAYGFTYSTEEHEVKFSGIDEIKSYSRKNCPACGSSCPMGCVCFTGDKMCRKN